ncbi:helix-turn-helix transcriptional regulator [Pseudomonas syringae]|uniref:helix-turn-helix domain-containing protein n=1 Tax=Pseudomonas syringae TaxID=317 RepID=UPI002D1FA60D|nr:helix-turn-helix transcriptional regulator [Pseudomonas syringae]
MRKARGLTLVELAARSGVTRQKLAEIEKGSPRFLSTFMPKSSPPWVPSCKLFLHGVLCLKSCTRSFDESPGSCAHRYARGRKWRTVFARYCGLPVSLGHCCRSANANQPDHARA